MVNRQPCPLPNSNTARLGDEVIEGGVATLKSIGVVVSPADRLSQADRWPGFTGDQCTGALTSLHANNPKPNSPTKNKNTVGGSEIVISVSDQTAQVSPSKTWSR